jgi:hypothetical protein
LCPADGRDAVTTQKLIIACEYGPSVFDLKDAASDLCDIIWAVDLNTPQMQHLARLMSRIGTVVDLAEFSEAQLLEKLSRLEPDGLLSLSDRTTADLANVALALGLDFHSPEVAGRLTDKVLQREALRAGGIPSPAFMAVPAEVDDTDIEILANAVGFPSVLKPRQGNGSRNTYPVRDREELTRLLSEGGASRKEADGMILEGYLAKADHHVSRFAPIVSVESFVRDGAIHHFAVTGRLPFAEPFRETGSVLPSDLSPEDNARARSMAADAIAALGVTCGCMHTEIKFTPDGPRIIEVNGRMGGGIPELVQLAGGDKSILRLGMELALGAPTGAEARYPRIAWRRTAPPPVSAGRIETIAGLDSLKDVPGLDLVTINRDAGESVDWRLGLADIVYQVYGSGDDYDEIERQCALVDRAVSVTYSNDLEPGRAADFEDAVAGQLQHSA